MAYMNLAGIEMKKNLVDRLFNWYFTKDAFPYWVILFIDVLICYFAGFVVYWYYYMNTLDYVWLVSKGVFVYMVPAVIGFRVFKTYSGVIRYSSFVDLQRVALAMLVGLVVALVIHYPMNFLNIEFQEAFNTRLFAPIRGRHIFLMYGIAVILMWFWRVLAKSVYDLAYDNDKGMRTLIYGVKDGGVGLAKNIRNQKKSKFLVKGFLSHDSTFHNKILLGLHVYNVDENLGDILDDLHINAVLVSPLQHESFRKDEGLQNLLLEKGLKIYISPDTKEWDGNVDETLNNLRKVNIEDLLPRDKIELNMDSVAEMLSGRRILVTGSAGSIGNELLKQICSFYPGKLMLIDSAETPQHDVRLMMKNDWPQIECTTIVGSIVNQKRMEHIFKTFRPEYVFHAAAYKHVPMMEDNPSVSILNNVLGTKVIADLSVKYGVRKFVMLSTDKAVNPTNVMGCSKRICEIYVQSLDKAIKEGKVEGRTCFVTTRFGNVLGSNGSVIPLFKQQIEAGGPVTVTHPNIIRYFMLIPEACKLVLEAGTQGKGGEIFIFDMGKPVRIADLAKKMIQLSGAKDVKIEYSGLRPGEKLFEELLANEENTLPSFHEKIRIAKVRDYDYAEASAAVDQLVEVAETYDDMKIVEKMKQIVPEFVSNNSIYSSLDK